MQENMAGRKMKFDWRISVLVALSAFTSSVSAQNAVTGRQLYMSTNGAPLSCGSPGPTCHGADPTQNVNNIRNGRTGAAILNAINNVPIMNFLRNAPFTVSAQNAADIAAYIVNPAAATAPAITLSGTSLAFASTQIGATNNVTAPAAITLTNTGAATLTITGVARTGTNATEFVAGGTCVGASVAVAVGASCTITGSFTPAAAGTRSATFTLQSNAASNPSIAVSGTSSAVATPILTRSGTSLTYNYQTVGTVSSAQAITITNSGTVPLTITQASGAPTPEFSASGNCVGTVAAGGQCTISVTFAPSAAGTRSGSVSIVSNAPGSPHAVALAGTGVLTPTPAAALSAATLSFAPQATGQVTRQAATLNNIGNAPLMIGSASIVGQNAADFRLSAGNTCMAGALAVSASCRLEVEFMPQSAGGKVATATVAHNAPAGPSAVALAGAATAPTGPNGSPTSSALFPSNVGGGGALSWYFAGLLLLATGLSARIRRRV
jgi:hypothetical protein